MILLWKETFYDDFMTVLRNVALLALLFMRIYGRCWCRCIKGKWVIKQVSWLIKFWHQINNLSRHYYYPQYPQNIHLQGVWIAQIALWRSLKMSDLKDSINPLSLLDDQRLVQRRAETSYMMIFGRKQLRSDNVTCSFCLRTDFDLAIFISPSELNIDGG